MEGCKKTENTTDEKENGESKIPKPATFSSAKETRSKTLVEKKKVLSSKTATKISDPKKCAAFGGIKLTNKRNTCRKNDAFKKVTTESKDPQAVIPPVSCTKILKTTDPVKAITNKGIAQSNKGNLEDPLTATRKHSKGASHTVTQSTRNFSEMKQTQVANLPKNIKRMSVVKISRDVEKQFQDENLKSDDQIAESDAGIRVMDKENTTKRATLKEKVSHASQKQSGSLTKKSSASDLKPCKVFGGIKLTNKRNTCRKSGVFQTVTKESKNPQAVIPPGACTKKLKTTDPVKAIAHKGFEQSNKGNLEVPSTATREPSKAASLTVTQTTLKKCSAFGGMIFTPNWQSTPLKPDSFENILKLSKHEKDINTPDSSAKCLEKIPDSTKAVTKEIETITLDETINLDETVQSPSKEPKYLKSASITEKEVVKLSSAFGGLRLTRKRKSTHPKPDVFELVQEESKINDQESPLSGTSEQMKMPSDTTKAVLKTENQHSHVEMLEQTLPPNPPLSETLSVTIKESCQVAAVGGIGFAPKWESTPIRPYIVESIQKETKADRLESYPTDSCAKESETIPVSTTAKIQVETQRSDDEKLELLTAQKPESLKIDEALKNPKKVAPPAFGGLRFKPRQKNLHNVFQAQKSKVDNQMQF